MSVTGPNNAPRPGFFQGLGQAADRAATVVGDQARFQLNGGLLGHTHITPTNNGFNFSVNPNSPNLFGQTLDFGRHGGVLGHTHVNPTGNGANVTVTPGKPNLLGQILGWGL